MVEDFSFEDQVPEARAQAIQESRPTPKPVESVEKPVESQETEEVSDKEIIESLQFYGNPIKFNMSLFEGMRIVLGKLTRIEEALNKLGKR